MCNCICQIQYYTYEESVERSEQVNLAVTVFVEYNNTSESTEIERLVYIYTLYMTRFRLEQGKLIIREGTRG